MIEDLIPLGYLVASALFILALKWLSHPSTARRGVKAGELGMLLAILATLVNHEIVSYQWIALGIVLGSVIGIPLAVLMPMTAVPQRTALSHAMGSLAAALVGTAEFYQHGTEMSAFSMGPSFSCASSRSLRTTIADSSSGRKAWPSTLNVQQPG